MKGQKGFSLLELMTTIAVLSLIGAVGFPATENFGDQENYENDLATIRGQVNIVRQLALEDGNAYTIRIVNDTDANTAEMQVWQAQGTKRYNIEHHQKDSEKCTDFGEEDDATDDKGLQLSDYNKQLNHITITRCTNTSDTCTKEIAADNNFFCFLPDGSAPENSKAEMKSSSNAGGRTDYLHFYQSGFFNNGKRM